MFIKSIRLKNLLSFQDASLTLRPLNILIGANGSGKSNLISAIALLRAAPQGPSGLPRIIPEGGGIGEWLSKLKSAESVAELETSFELPGWPNVVYRLDLGSRDLAYYIGLEQLFADSGKGSGSRTHFIERNLSSARLLHSSGGTQESHPLGHETMLSLFRNPNDITPLNALATALSDIRIFREFQTGPQSPARNGSPTGTARGYLSDGGDNLALVLNDLDYHNELAPVSEALQRFWENAQSIKVRLEGAIARVDIHESGLKSPTPGLRLSDGTLKFLCLTAVLLHPRPPALVCIEEPELGLHPDALAIVADALRSASERCQLIVTTHSADLVSAFSGSPEAVVVCEREPGAGTQFRRLKSAKLAVWLEKYRLGELWRKGEIGGNRW